MTQKYAVIDKGVVVNIIIAQPGSAALPSGAVNIESVSPSPSIGWTYNGGVFTAPVVPTLSWSDPALDSRYFWIDVGPFFDRFGAKALSITGSADVQVQGLVTLLLPRKYVDLKRADLPSMLDLLVSKGLITAAEKTAVLNPITTEYERHIKGLEQPK